MYHAETTTEKIKLFLTILWPIMTTQLSLFAMNLVDTMMSGRAGTDDLAGVAIGSSLWMPVFTAVNGVLLAMTTIIAQLMGRGRSDQVHASVTQSMYLAVMLTVVVLITGSAGLNTILAWMSLDPGVYDISYRYLIGLSLGILPMFLFFVLRNFFDGQGLTKITMYILLLALPVNITANYGLIFGNFGLPELGGAGAGYATAITYWTMFMLGALMTFRLHVVSSYQLFINWVKPSLTAWKEQLALGIPMGLSLFFEASIFSVVTLLIGVMFATETIAANKIVLNFTSLIFMIPLSISMAITIVVGFSVGGKRLDNARRYSVIGVGGGVGVLAVGAVFLYFFRETIAYWYTDNPDVVAIAMTLFLVAIVYQLSDALQSGLQGVLRGYKDVKLPFYIAFVSYWLLGLPVGYSLAAFTALGPIGFWLGITLGLTSAAAGFAIRLRTVQRRAAESVES